LRRNEFASDHLSAHETPVPALDHDHGMAVVLLKQFAALADMIVNASIEPLVGHRR
jgi:hypothetical protein